MAPLAKFSLLPTIAGWKIIVLAGLLSLVWLAAPTRAQWEATPADALKPWLDRQEKLRSLPPDVRELVEAKKVRIGMTAEQVLLSWGKPKQINRTLSATSAEEQWVYPGSTEAARWNVVPNDYLYFTNGVLRSIQTSR